jgi:hypothetical protein
MSLVQFDDYRSSKSQPKKVKRTPTNEVVDLLEELKVPYTIKTLWHLKVDIINYYPSKGTIYVDCEEFKRNEKGLEGLKKVLKEFGHI